MGIGGGDPLSQDCLAFKTWIPTPPLPHISGVVVVLVIIVVGQSNK